MVYTADAATAAALLDAAVGLVEEGGLEEPDDEPVRRLGAVLEDRGVKRGDGFRVLYIAILGAPAGSIPEGTAVALTSSVSDPGTTDSFRYQWTVTASGGTPEFQSNFLVPGTTPTFGFTPVEHGTYRVTLAVTDTDYRHGCVRDVLLRIRAAWLRTRCPAQDPRCLVVGVMGALDQ